MHPAGYLTGVKIGSHKLHTKERSLVSMTISAGAYVLAGGLITGDIRVNGYLKVQATFARICG